MANNTIDRPHNPELEKKYKPLVIVLSIVIPVVVAVLFGMPKVEGVDLSFLPPIYATINGITAVLLVMAVITDTLPVRGVYTAILVIMPYWLWP